MPDNFMGLQDFGIEYKPPKSPYEVLPRQHLGLFQKINEQDTRGQIEGYAKRVASGESLEQIDLKDKADTFSKQAMQLASQTEGMDDKTFEDMRQQLQQQVQARPQVPMVQQAQAPTSGQQIVAALGSLFFPQYAGKIGTLPYQAQEAQAKTANENAGRQYQSDFEAYKQNVDLAANDLQDFQRRDQFRVNQKNDSNRTQANLLQGEANRIYGEINRVQDNKRQDRQNAFGYLLKADTPGEVEIAAKFLEDSGTPLPPDVIERAKQGATDKQQKLGMGLMRDLQRQIENYGGIQNEAQRASYAAYAQDIADKYGIPVPPMLIGKNVKGQTVDLKQKALEEAASYHKAQLKSLSEKEAKNYAVAMARVDIARQEANTSKGRLTLEQYKASKPYIEMTKAQKDAKTPVTAILTKLKGEMAKAQAEMRSTKDRQELEKATAKFRGLAAELSSTAGDAVDNGVLSQQEANPYQNAVARAFGHNPDVSPASPALSGAITNTRTGQPAPAGFGSQNQGGPSQKAAPKPPAKPATSPEKRNDLPPGIRTTKGGAKWSLGDN